MGLTAADVDTGTDGQAVRDSLTAHTGGSGIAETQVTNSQPTADRGIYFADAACQGEPSPNLPLNHDVSAQTSRQYFASVGTQVEDVEISPTMPFIHAEIELPSPELIETL